MSSVDLPKTCAENDNERQGKLFLGDIGSRGKRYGDDAMLEAGERAGQLLDLAVTWHWILNSEEETYFLRTRPELKGKILNAIERLQAKAPAEGEKVH